MIDTVMLDTSAYHEVANIFPMMGDEEYSALVDDIRANGQLEPIWRYQGKIIDGRNRYKACFDLGIEPIFREWRYDGSLIEFVVSLNLKRRHLSSSQKAMVALGIEEQLAKEAKERQRLAGCLYGEAHPKEEVVQIFAQPPSRASEQAASIVGTNHAYVTDAKKIVAHSPELKAAVLQGSITIPQAKRQIKEQKREEKREDNRQEIAQSKTVEQALTVAKFSTIVIDPPWDWSDEGDVDQMGRAKPTYGTMTIEQLLALPVGSYADDDCHLYLWITNRSLPKGFRLLEAWGFRYVTCVTWVKPYFGMGNYFRGQTEHILFGVKGSQPLKRKDAPTYFEAPRGPNGHSSKPIESYGFIESCSPGPYLEMFARSQRPDWTSWGAEV